MCLTIAIPEARVVRAPVLLRWMRTAAAYWIESDEEGALYVAVFNDFPNSAEAVARLLSEADDLRDVRIALDGRPIVNHAFFSESLLCYGRSLHAPSDDCRRWAISAKADRACADRSCVSPCWLICSACLMRPRDQQPAQRLEASSFTELARHAEVEWCPRLHL
ncbi:MAG: hypothetical protein NNA30_08015 [Nitrospira sp.]|nr:hypothetical protein [Nitrospira sp.]